MVEGGSIIEEDKFSGGAGIRLEQPGDRVAFTLNPDRAGFHRLLVRGLVNETGTFVYGDIIVNGELQTRNESRAMEFFHYTSTNPADEAAIIPLEAGENIVEIEFRGLRGKGIDDLEIDYISFGFDSGIAMLPLQN